MTEQKIENCVTPKRKVYIASQLDGRPIRVTAIATTVASANAYLEQHPDEGHLDTAGPLIFIASKSDLGADIPTLADQVVALVTRIDDALLPECRAARAALKSMPVPSMCASARRIARDLHDAIPGK